MGMNFSSDFYAVLTDEYVAIANRGQPFTREGLRAICQAHISPKSSGLTTPIADEADAVVLQEEIRKQRLDVYRSCPSDLAEHANAESVLRSEYAGRILPELLQNAYDALAAEKIGSKGVGFKAVLNICEEPRIHSGYLHCGFDRPKSRELLQDTDLIEDSDDVPLLRFPFPLEPGDEPPPVRDLIGKYDTVIVLPFTDLSARARFLSDWEKCVGDAKLLLFLKDLRLVVWERRDGTNNSTRVWIRQTQDACVQICDGADQDNFDRWRLWQSERASVAVRLNDDGSLVAERDYPNIRVFFETIERPPLPLLMHAKFPLKEGRDNVLTEDEDSRQSVRQVAQEVAGCVREAFAEVSDAKLLLDLLKPRIEPKQMGKLESELWNALKDKLSAFPIPETNGVRLDQVRVRPEYGASKWWFNCDLWNDFKGILSEHSAPHFVQLPLLPPGVDTDEREKTILYFNPAARLSVEELLALPLLPIDGSDQFISPNGSNIFLPPKESPPLAPPEVDVQFLDSDFVNRIDAHQRNRNLHKFLEELLDISKFEPINLLKKAILPFLKELEGPQPEGMLNFLCSVVEPELKDDDVIFEWRDPVRREFAERIIVPTRHGDGLPAAKVYAGSDWTGHSFLDRAYGDCPDRGFLKPPPTDEKAKLRWQRFYQWVGVGWCPKVLPIVCFEDRPKIKKGPQGQEGYFPVDTEPRRWSAYCKTIKNVYFEYQPRMRQNWTLDGDEAVLLLDDAFSIVSNNWEYYKLYKDASGFQSSNRQEDYDNNRWRSPSYLIWLLRTSRWIPVKGVSEKQQSKDVFARPEIVHKIGGWAYELEADVHEDFLNTIEVRSGWQDINGSDWKRWLDRAASLSQDKVNQGHKENIRCLYFAALRYWEYQHGVYDYDSYQGPLWGVERNRDNTEDWRLLDKREGIYFVDRPDLAELRIPELYIFPVELNRLENVAKNRFKLRLLSEYLSGEPVESKDMDNLSGIVRKRTETRLDVINAYLKMKPGEKVFNFGLADIPEMRVVEQLKVNFKIDGKIIDLMRDAYHAQGNDKRHMLWLSRELFTGKQEKPGHIVWEYVASALVYIGGLSLDEQSCLKDLLLYEDEDLKRKLLQLGITKETVDQVTSDITKPPVENGPDSESDKPETTGPFSSSENPPDPTNKPPGDNGSGPTGGGSSNSPLDPSLGWGGGTHGLDAQEWMREQLKNRLNANGWEVSLAPTRDEERRETDIELVHAQQGRVHVEVKHCETSKIFWSEKEVEKAQNNPGRYFMVIIIRGGEDQYKEYWIDNPLDKLKTLPRTGVWVWRGREDNVGLPEQDAAWAVPSPRAQRPAAGFSFKIDITEDWMRNFGVKFGVISARLLQNFKQD